MDAYGKVVDQDGSPVEGVIVEEGVGTYISPSRSGSDHYYAKTDSEGAFRFSGIHGAWAGFDFKKEGYKYNLKSQSATRPAGYVPDVNHPLIFTLWKSKGAEPLVHRKIEAGLPCNGEAMTLDILTGHRVASGGDLTLNMIRLPENIDDARPFDWSLTLTAAGGGLTQIADTYGNEAPVDGYQRVTTISMHAGPPTFTGNRFDQQYYLKSRDGQVYGRLKIHISADYQPPPARLEIEVFANPAGSRNLEYDSSKQAYRQ